jgi:hypothetical protein
VKNNDSTESQQDKGTRPQSIEPRRPHLCRCSRVCQNKGDASRVDSRCISKNCFFNFSLSLSLLTQDLLGMQHSRTFASNLSLTSFESLHCCKHHSCDCLRRHWSPRQNHCSQRAYQIQRQKCILPSDCRSRCSSSTECCVLFGFTCVDHKPHLYLLPNVPPSCAPFVQVQEVLQAPDLCQV